MGLLIMLNCLIYTLNKKLINALKDVISLKFKTMQSDGILLHREGQNGDHITLELTKGKLSLLINLGDTKTHPSNAQINITLGSLLDDQHWHSVLIEHFNNQVNFTVDKHTHHFHAKGEFSYLDLDYELSFGGIPVPGKSGALSRRNFHGCFENIYYNGVNIIDVAKRHKSQIYFVGNVSFSCLEPQVVPITFLTSSSYLALPGPSGQDEVLVSFQFRTWNKEGLLLSSQLHQSSGGLLLYLSDGRVKINLHKTGRVLSDIAAGAGLNNGQWHSVSLSVKRNRISVRVDNDVTSSAHASIPLQIYSGDVFYFGGRICCLFVLTIPNSYTSIFPDISNQMTIIVWLASSLLCLLCGTERCLKTHCFLTSRNKVFRCIWLISSYMLFPLLTYATHNSTNLTRVKSANRENPHTVFFKYSASLDQLQATINLADHCEQELAYYCKKSRLLDKSDGMPLSWWIGRTNETHTYWGGSLPTVQKCACGLEGNCIDSQHFCNCDADRDEW
uniref:Laminin G domain-containing protein n=1 Tax=Malurus cyaneus samueli TaxID=2593467 RepID=A0A8C5TKK8_9PASS